MGDAFRANSFECVPDHRFFAIGALYFPDDVVKPQLHRICRKFVRFSACRPGLRFGYNTAPL